MGEKSENYGFDKNEGFIGNVDDFNGIIFYLREANTAGNESTEFWFKRIVNEKEKYYKELEEEISKIKVEEKKEEETKKKTINKRIATRFENEFSGILKQLKFNESLSDIAFCNVNPKGGGKCKGQKYEEALKKAHTKLEKIVILNPQNELQVFTCVDIYEKLKNAWKDKYVVKEEEQKGIQYLQTKTGKTVKRNRFTCQIADKNVTVYDIYHPSRVGVYKL